MTDPRTISVYDAHAEDYAKRFDGEKPDKHLSDFMNALPNGGTILDLGCGTGRSTAHMVNSGFSVVGMDASVEMLKLAKAKSNATFIQATFDELGEENMFDGVWANFSLLHAPRGAFPSHLNAIHRSLKPKGIFHIGVKTGTGSSRDTIDRLYTYYSQQELNDHLNEAGFEVIQTTLGEGKGLAGSVDPWIIILAKRT